MDILRLYEADVRAFDDLGLCDVRDAYDITRRETLSGEHTLSFRLPYASDCRELLQTERILVSEGQAFRIRRLEVERSEKGIPSVSVFCEHISYDLNTLRHLPDLQSVVNVTAEEVFMTGFVNENGTAFDGILSGTDFTLISDLHDPVDLFLSKTNPREVLSKITELLSCEVIFDNFLIHLVERRGNENAAEIRFGRNLKSVKRTVDSSEVITRLYPYGADYLDITSVNDGTAYLDSPLIGSFDTVREGYMDYPDIETPEELMEEALKEWESEESIDKPKVSYDVSFAELKRLGEPLERIAVGDTVHICDEGLGFSVTARVMEYEEKISAPQSSRVVLANYREQVGGILGKMQTTLTAAERVLNSKGEVRDSFIESVRRTMAVQFQESLQKKTVLHDYASMWVDDLNNPTAAIALVDGQFALANSKNADGTWNWRTMADATGLVADRVSADWIYTGTVNADQINGRNLNIENGTVVIDNDDGSRTEITAEGVKVIHRSGDYTLLNRKGIRRYVNDELIPMTWIEQTATAQEVSYNGNESVGGVIFLEGAIWKEIATAYQTATAEERESMLKTRILGAEVDGSEESPGGYSVYFDYVHLADGSASNLILPTNDSGVTKVELSKSKSLSITETVTGDGAVMAIYGRAWYYTYTRTSSSVVVSTEATQCHVEAEVKGSPDFA